MADAVPVRDPFDLLADPPTPWRDYAVGLPVTIRVHDDRQPEAIVHLQEATVAMRDDVSEDVKPEDVELADVATVEAAFEQQAIRVRSDWPEHPDVEGEPTATPQRAQRWLANAPYGLRRLLERITWHKDVEWLSAEYEGSDDERQVTTDINEAEAFSSLVPRPPALPEGWPDKHKLLLDLDVPAWLVPSSTPDHSHLYVDLDVPDEKLWTFLEAAVDIGLVEQGYLDACRSRGMTSLRAPWVHKGQETDRD